MHTGKNTAQPCTREQTMFGNIDWVVEARIKDGRCINLEVAMKVAVL